MTTQSRFILYGIPNEKIVEENGAVKVTFKFDAANIRQARAMATMSFIEKYPEANDEDYELVVYEETTGLPCGPLNVWDEEVLAHYYWNPTTKLPEYCEPGTEGQPDLVDFGKLSATLRAAALVKFGSTEITADMLTAAIDLTQEEAATFDGHIVEAIVKTPAISAMYPERQLEAIAHIREKCKPTKKWPEIKAALDLWLKEHEKQRKEAAAEPNREAVVSEASAAVYAGRSYEHTYRTLNKEIAYALWAGDVDPAKTDPSISRWAEGVMHSDREDWKRWSAAIVTRENILAYDRPTIFSLVRNAPKPDIYKTPAALNLYIDEYLQQHGVTEGGDNENSQQNTENQTGPLAEDAAATGAEAGNDDPETPSVERQGPFYYRTADGQPSRANKLAKLEAVIEQGCIEITKEEYQALKETPPVQQQASSDQPGINNLGNGRFSIEGLAPEQPQTDEKSASNEVAKKESASQPVTDPYAFVLRADELEKELGDSENISLWKSVMRTNPRYTKDMGDIGFGGTSINAEYMVMRATESFGPVGIGWGWTILEDKMEEGAPLSEKIFEGNKYVGKRTLRDADGSLIYELNHRLRITLWFIKDGKRGSVENFGSTPYRQTTKNGIYCDSEVHKKSLTDAIKKCLSMLGFSADVWLGLFDDPAYKAESALEFGIKDAAEKADDSSRIREELDERFKQNVETMRKAVSQNEVSKIASSLTRTVGIHLKSAKEINDQEYAKYLEGRLRRLEEVKSECLAKLQEKAA